MLKWMWFFCGLAAGLTALSISKAAVPDQSPVPDHTAIHQSVSEIQVKKELEIDFDLSLSELHSRESSLQYREKPPTFSGSPRLKGPIERVSRQKYRSSRST